MNITIVCGHFIPALGYLEVHLAKAFAQLNHRTSVITSSAIPNYVSHLTQDFGKDPENVEVIRIEPALTLGQIVIAKGINKTLRRLDPDVVVVIGLGKAFPKPVFKSRYKIISLLGDNAHSYASTSLKSKILLSIFKKPTYRAAIRHSAKLIAYTPESFHAAAKMLAGKDAEKLLKQDNFVSLGFWSDEFYFSPLVRTAKRVELGYSDSDKVIITATRVVANKKLEAFIPALAAMPYYVKWLIVGSAQDEYARELADIFENFLGKNRVKILPYVAKTQLNALYNAADLALYTVPAISIFEAIGTGLQAVVGEDRSLERIWKSRHFYAPYRGGNTDLSHFARDGQEDHTQREARSIAAQEEFSWTKIAEEVVKN